MQKRAVIDMGTNSVRLMLAELEDGRIKHATKELDMTRLGKGVDETAMLSQESMDATVKAIQLFKTKAEAFGAESIKTIATSAVRDALNREAFVTRVKAETGIDIEVISGQREAELGFKGVLSGVAHQGSILVVDIGGGSTEFIVGDNQGIAFAVSENVGAVRMTGKHLTQDPVDAVERHSMVEDIDAILASTLHEIQQREFEKIVGIGGTITTISAMKQQMATYDPTRIQNSIVTKEDMDRMLEQLKVMNNDERKMLPGLMPKRADIIFAGITIMERILDALGQKEVIVSDCDNLEGTLFEDTL